MYCNSNIIYVHEGISKCNTRLVIRAVVDISGELFSVFFLNHFSFLWKDITALLYLVKKCSSTFCHQIRKLHYLNHLFSFF